MGLAVAKQFYWLREIHSLVYGHRQAIKMAANIRISFKGHLMNYLVKR